MNKNKFCPLAIVMLFLIPLFLSSYAVGQMPNEPIVFEEKSSFNPVVRPKATMDTNNNKIHDHLEGLIRSGFQGSHYKVIVTFDQPVTKALISKIAAIGGEVLATWSVIYGAAIRIKARTINSLATLPEVTFITENYRSRALLSTSTRQINVRPYVWNTLGYEGDSTQTIAIIDTGVDDSHSDLSGKVTHWEDFAGYDADTPGDEYATATDWSGHGTHCASIAVGTGTAAGTASSVEVSGTIGLPVLDAQQGIVGHAEVESSGSVRIEADWDDKGGNSPSDTLFIALDINQDETFTGDDIIVHGDYGSPLVLTSGILSTGKYMFLIGPWEAGELGKTCVQYTIQRPAASLPDGENNYRGVAPNCDIVALKALDDTGSGYEDQMLDALDWVYDNGDTYDIVVCSMSLGFTAEITAVDTAVNNLVSEGYVCVAAAGNEFLEYIDIASPGTAEKAITVGAIDDVDKIAIYSSNGSPSHAKPDVVAPGGAYKAPIGADEDTHPIIAADTNDKDLVSIVGEDPPENYWQDELNSNDYQAIQGTSMATPHVAGLAALIIQAMSTDWTHSEADALRVKNYICGTATEVIEGESVGGTYNTPTLNRGDSDKVEGFGKVHGDAAIEAFLSTYVAGTVATESLGSLPTDKQCWARKVELQASIEFTAGIEMAGSADYDLYLYDPSVDMSQYLGILASSTSAGSGTPENIIYTPASAMTAYIVVKRVSGSGSFTLQAEATKTGTPTTPTTSGTGTGFTFPFAIPVLAWAVLGTIGLASLLIITKRRK